MSLVMINFWYVVAAALFIFGLKKLGSPDSAVKGNMYSAAAMLIAVAVTLFNENSKVYLDHNVTFCKISP